MSLYEESLSIVIKSENNLKEYAERMRKWNSVKIPFKGSVLLISYQRNDSGDFEYYLEYSQNGDTFKKNYIEYGYRDNLHWLLCDVGELLYGKIGECDWDLKKEFILIDSTKETISENPIFNAALEQDDKLLALILKLHYGIADDDECSFLSDLFGYRILPALSEEYNKEYVIEGDIDRDLLQHSGYRMLHRPYFALMGCARGTDRRKTLNPHTKQGVDAGSVSLEAISFQEYLKLFDCKKETE